MKMTMHYGKSLKELTAEDIWFGAQMNLGGSNGETYIPGAYGTFCEADHYAYDAWRYLEHLKRVGIKTPEEWLANSNMHEDEKDLYLSLLKEIRIKYDSGMLRGYK